MTIKEIDVKTVLSKSNLPAENLNLRGDYRPVILDWMNYITGFIPRKDAGMFFWYDYLLAVVWFIVNFVFFFRSKIYWGLGKKPGYALTEQSAFGVGYKK